MIDKTIIDPIKNAKPTKSNIVNEGISICKQYFLRIIIHKH